MLALIGKIHSKMPETSQDAYELLHPKKHPISVAELRTRSNSIGNRKLSSSNAIDDPVAIESNFLWPPGKRKPRESRVSISDFDSVITAPEMIYGYKREISHRCVRFKSYYVLHRIIIITNIEIENLSSMVSIISSCIS